MACAGLQVDGDVGCSWIEGADVSQVVDVVAVAIADGVVIFTNEDLQISVSAILREHNAAFNRHFKS